MVDQVRKYHNVDLIQVMSTLGGVGQWRSGIHFLDSSYGKQLNNLGRAVEEPFGNREQIGTLSKVCNENKASRSVIRKVYIIILLVFIDRL